MASRFDFRGRRRAYDRTVVIFFEGVSGVGTGQGALLGFCGVANEVVDEGWEVLNSDYAKGDDGLAHGLFVACYVRLCPCFLASDRVFRLDLFMVNGRPLLDVQRSVYGNLPNDGMLAFLWDPASRLAIAQDRSCDVERVRFNRLRHHYNALGANFRVFAAVQGFVRAKRNYATLAFHDFRFTL